MKKLLPVLVCGFAAGVLNTVPFVKNFGCCLIIPIAVYFALVLDLRSRGDQDPVKPAKAMQMGLLTGVFCAIFVTLFEMLIILITRSSDLVAGLPEIERMMSQFAESDISRQMMNILYKIRDDIVNYGFSLLYTFSMLMSSLLVNSIVGMIGGLLAMQFINSRLKKE